MVSARRSVPTCFSEASTQASLKCKLSLSKSSCRQLFPFTNNHLPPCLPARIPLICFTFQSRLYPNLPIPHLVPSSSASNHVIQRSAIDFTKRKKKRDGNVTFAKIFSSAEYKNDLLTSKLKMSLSARVALKSDLSVREL